MNKELHDKLYEQISEEIENHCQKLWELAQSLKLNEFDTLTHVISSHFGKSCIKIN